MYEPATSGLSEARLLAIRDILVSHLDDLNTVINRFPWAAPPKQIDAGHIIIGDHDRGWAYETKGCLRISVCDGGSQSGQDFTAEPFQTAVRWKTTLTTAIYCLLHPEWFRMADPDTQAEQRELIRAAISDWMRAVFNDYDKYGHVVIPLVSQEYNYPEFDLLQMCYARSGFKGLFSKSFGKAEMVYGFSIIHEGSIA